MDFRFKKIVRKNFPATGLGDIHIAGIMGVCDFPLAPLMAIRLSQHVDYLVLRYDCCNRGKFGGVLRTMGKGGKYHFDLLTTLNPFKIPVEHVMDVEPRRPGECLLSRLMEVRPDFVFQCDSDETYPFESGFYEDFDEFVKRRDYWFMKFEWEMITNDGRPVPLAPIAKHVKVYRWHPEVSYHKGAGFGQPYFPHPRKYLIARHRMQHYWAFTRELEKQKVSGYIKARPHVVEQIYFHGGAYERWKRLYGHTMPRENWIENRRPELEPHIEVRKRNKGIVVGSWR